MKNKNNNHQFDSDDENLIALDYLTGDLSAEQRLQFEELLKVDLQAQQTLAEMTRLTSILSTTDYVKTETSSLSRPFLYRLAASLVVACLLITIVVPFVIPQKSKSILTQDPQDQSTSESSLGTNHLVLLWAEMRELDHQTFDTQFDSSEWSSSDQTDNSFSESNVMAGDTIPDWMLSALVAQSTLEEEANDDFDSFEETL